MSAVAEPRAAMRPVRKPAASAAFFLGPATMVVLVMMCAPLVLLARFSLDRFDPTKMMIAAFTGANYLRFVTEPYYLDVMRTTVFVAVSATALCLLLGIPIAYRLARTQSRYKSTMVLLVILPLFMGGTVRAVGWMILFAHGGMLDLAVAAIAPGHGLDLMYTSTAVMIGILSFNMPYMVLMLQAVFEKIDPALEEAARGLGAAPGRAFWRIVWPLSLPGMLIATILSFIMSMNAYATPVLLGGPRFHMMAPQVYVEFATNNNWPFAAALAFILTATTLALTLVANRLIPGRYRAP
ncbi:MAG TPA: ABC transporter permease [Acetobacteraceae bacterium]|nr:ABC transporter permease [Acetobacteraceae bacterium]